MRARNIQVLDDRNRPVCLEGPPERIVSLVPSDTYNVVRLGGAERLVGRTSYCVEPADAVEHVPIVGGTKDADPDAILALRPDVVLANQEENTRSTVLRLEHAGVKVLVAFPKRVAAGAAHLARLARLLGEPSPLVKQVVASAYAALRRAEAHAAQVERPWRAFVPIWMDPLMTANADTFLSDVLALCGATNVFAERARRYPLAADLGKATPQPQEALGGRDTRYPRVTLDEVRAMAPDLVLLPDEPHAFSADDAKVFASLDIPAARNAAILHVEGKDLLWPGLRSLEGLDRLRAAIAALPASPRLS
jgi:ABC-type Fe3+-hydroxamate transport system substrate-binding protein